MTDPHATCGCPEPEKFGHDVMLKHEPMANAPAVESGPTAKAREICDWLNTCEDFWMGDLCKKIAAALEAERKALTERFANDLTTAVDNADAEGHRRGLEEAAEMVDLHSAQSFGYPLETREAFAELAERIRAKDGGEMSDIYKCENGCGERIAELESQLRAADELARAAETHIGFCLCYKGHCRLLQALAAWEKVRGR